MRKSRFSGRFSIVGKPTGGCAPISTANGVLGAGNEQLRVTGTVWDILPGGTGGWFLVGEFSAVGGVPRRSLAHVRSLDKRLALDGARLKNMHGYNSSNRPDPNDRNALSEFERDWNETVEGTSKPN